MPENYIIQQQTATSPVGARNIGQIFLGTVAFPVEAGKTYYIFSPKSQVDFYGFAYTYDQAAFEAADPLPTPEVPTSIEAVKNIQPKDDGAIYNLAGQKVDKSFKGGMTNPVVVRHIDDKGTNATTTTKCIYQT